MCTGSCGTGGKRVLHRTLNATLITCCGTVQNGALPQTPSFPEEASRFNERGNLPLHAACSFQATAEVVDTLIRAYPTAVTQANTAGNLPIHQACMWQAPAETVELLLQKYPEGATVRNQYGSLPLHMAASNQASPEVVRLLIEAYPDALHLQNDDGMTPLDLALADEGSANETVVAMLEGRPPPPELTRRQKAEKYEERALALERKLSSLRDSSGKRDKDLKNALAAVRRLADRIPHALYAAGMDPNQLEITLSETAVADEETAENILLDAIRKRHIPVLRDTKGIPVAPSATVSSTTQPRDRVEDLLSTVVALDHIKSHVRGLRRSAELADLRESLLPATMSSPTSMTPRRAGMGAAASVYQLVPPAVAEDLGRPHCNHMVFCGNPGSGKTSVARLLAKVFHELGLLRKPKFLQVERMDLAGKDPATTIAKTREVLEEARGGILLIDEAYTLGMASRRNRADTGNQCMAELVKAIHEAQVKHDDSFPLIILAGFPLETQAFLAFQPELRKCFTAVYEFPDYTCMELARIFIDLALTKGFELEDKLTPQSIALLLEQETTPVWRSERNGRICEMLLTGIRNEVRKRMRKAQMEEKDEFDPHMILYDDVAAVMQTDFK